MKSITINTISKTNHEPGAIDTLQIGLGDILITEGPIAKVSPNRCMSGFKPLFMMLIAYEMFEGTGVHYADFYCVTLREDHTELLGARLNCAPSKRRIVFLCGREEEIIIDQETVPQMIGHLGSYQEYPDSDLCNEIRGKYEYFDVYTKIIRLDQESFDRSGTFYPLGVKLADISKWPKHAIRRWANAHLKINASNLIMPIEKELSRSDSDASAKAVEKAVKTHISSKLTKKVKKVLDPSFAEFLKANTIQRSRPADHGMVLSGPRSQMRMELSVRNGAGSINIEQGLICGVKDFRMYLKASGDMFEDAFDLIKRSNTMQMSLDIQRYRIGRIFLSSVEAEEYSRYTLNEISHVGIVVPFVVCRAEGDHGLQFSVLLAAKQQRLDFLLLLKALQEITGALRMGDDLYAEMRKSMSAHDAIYIHDIPSEMKYNQIRQELISFFGADEVCVANDASEPLPPIEEIYTPIMRRNPAPTLTINNDAPSIVTYVTVSREPMPYNGEDVVGQSDVIKTMPEENVVPNDAPEAEPIQAPRNMATLLKDYGWEWGQIVNPISAGTPDEPQEAPIKNPEAISEVQTHKKGYFQDYDEDYEEDYE